MTGTAKLPPRNEDRELRGRDRWKSRRRMLIAFTGLAALAAVLSSQIDVTSLVFHDPESRIAYERNARRLRASWGMPMPGQPDLTRLPQRLAEHGLTMGAPILMRIFKSEFELELWMLRDGRYHRFATYPICRWSGTLGPKKAEGDRQAPEGFYTVARDALNPNSDWYRSFNLGYPNAFDRAHGRTGGLLMVHGGCASIGCYAMTNAQIDEIWRLVIAALDGGQKRFQVQVYPFRMSDERMAAGRDHPEHDFWSMLKAGNDIFEATLLPPRVSVCRSRYTFQPSAGAADADIPIAERCTTTATTP